MLKIKENISLKKYNTFGIDVKSRFFVECSSVQDIIDFIKIYQKQQIPLLPLSGGSNILFTKNFEGYILRLLIKGIEVINETNHEIEVRVGAGEDWDNFVEYCVKNNWGGIENLSLIPGNVGTCPIQNIGAYGVEVKDVITNVETLEIASLKTHCFENSDCNFEYRNSIFKSDLKGKHLITHVTFKLSKQPQFKLNYGSLAKEMSRFDKIDLTTIRKTIIDIRNSKLPDPEKIGNSGSFFKNPIVKYDAIAKLKEKYPDMPTYKTDSDMIKIPAGWLIEKAGWKGKRINDAGVHNKQALVLVNYGNACGKEIFSLAKDIQKSIKDMFDINIEMEVNII